MPTAGSGHTAATVRDRRRGGFHWSTLTVAGLADPLRGGTAGAGRHCDRRLGGKLDDFGLIGGFTHQTTQILPATARAFCIVYLWRQILKSDLKGQENWVNERLN